ncbi:MAG: GNAT family N-acetyltransferase [Planctomycetota bacterium]|nr:MAG: GNAT family N-acetyltransferase [Planctomycetota bacterium]
MSDIIEIRFASEADCEIIAQFNIDMAFETEELKLIPAVITAGVKNMLANPSHGFYLVATIEEKIIGCLMITKEWSDWRNGLFWWIQSVYVMADFRGRGVYRQLYNHVQLLAQKEDNVCGFRLYVEQDNMKAQSTYKKLGMAETNYKLYEQLIPDNT